MIERDTYRKGWCPGALRPMRSGDGLLVRLRLPGGGVTAALGRAIAACAAEFGSGLIDLTARGNLQLRGVRQPALPSLQAALDTLGLLDADAAAEAVRNILASPLAGIDPTALLDIRPCTQALDARLRRDPALHRLPGKFGFLIDDGGCLPLAPDAADIAFLARPGRETPYFAVHLGGRPAMRCAPDDLADTAARLAQAFLALRGTGRDAPSRMRPLVERRGVAAVVEAADLQAAPEDDAVPRLPPAQPIGWHELGRRSGLGVGIPFGRLDAAGLRLLAEAAAVVGGELRLTPWRAILLIGTTIDAAVAGRLRRAGFILDPAAALRAVAACPGAAGCANGTTATQADAARLAPSARRFGADGVGLHVSGCAKGCAHANPAPVTLIGRQGHYDVVLGGGAGDTPVLSLVTLAELDDLLPRLAAATPPDRAAVAHHFAAKRSQ